MNQLIPKQIMRLRSTKRQVFPLTWTGGKGSACPWNQDTHMRVTIPFTAVERRNSDKNMHIQIVRKDSLEIVSA